VKKLFSLILILAILGIIIQVSFNFLVGGHTVIYNIDNDDTTFNIKETFSVGHQSSYRYEKDRKNYFFEIIVNNELWLLNNGKQRALIILEELFKSLNDVDINGIGSLRFYNDYPCRIRFYNKNFTGYNLMMKTRLT